MKVLRIVPVAIILLFTLFLRFHNYTEYPQRGATSDEYTYAFLGVSLLKDHVPISWSFFDYKNKENITIQGIYFPIVQPYFDHPPLYGLLVGGWSIFNGQDTFEKIDLKTIRMVPIFLATISSLLLFLIAQKLYGYKVALWSMLIFSTTTLFVMNMKVVVAENLLTALLLSSLCLFVYTKNMNYKKAVLLGVLCGLALLTKIVGVSVFFIMLYFLLQQKIQRKYIATVGVVFLGFAVGLLGYAGYFDWSLFWEIQREQGGRKIGPQTVLLLTTTPSIINKIFYDGWYFFGFFSLFVSFGNFIKNKIIIIPTFIYFMILLLTLTREGHSGWYLIPFFPFFSIAAALLIEEALDKASFLYFVFLFFVGMAQIQFVWEPTFGLSPIAFRSIVFVLCVPLLFTLLFNHKNLFKLYGTFLFYLFIAGNIFMTYHYVHPS